MTKSRLESFNDAILAIIMTIMALEIHTPEEPTLSAFIKILIPLFAFFSSFFGLTNLWIAHHRMLKNAKYISYRSVFINVALLFWVTMVPVSTSWVADFPTKALPQQFFIILQLGWFFLLQALIVSIENDNQQTRSSFSVMSWWTIAVLIFFLFFPIPYSALIISLIIIIRVPILIIFGERKAKKEAD